MVELKFQPSGREPLLGNQAIKVFEPGLLSRSQVEADDVSEITSAEAGVQAQPGRLLECNFAEVSTTAALGFHQSMLDRFQLDAFADSPKGVHKRKARPVLPLLTKVESVGKSRQTCAHRAIADQEHGVGIDVLGLLRRGKEVILASTP